MKTLAECNISLKDIKRNYKPAVSKGTDSKHSSLKNTYEKISSNRQLKLKSDPRNFAKDKNPTKRLLIPMGYIR